MTSHASPTTATGRDSRWWLLIIPGLATTLATAVSSVVFGVPAINISSLSEPLALVVGLTVLTTPAVVAIGIHFDRKYVASVSEWEPRSEYVLLGIAMWFGFGIPLALLYLYRRHEYVGVP